MLLPFVRTILDAWVLFSLLPVLPTGCQLSSLRVVYTQTEYFNGCASKELHRIELGSDMKNWQLSDMICY